MHVSEEPFVPSGFVVPLAIATEQFRLEPLGPQHNDSDYEDRGKDDNLRDLEGHADDFAKRAGFSYTVLDHATGDVIGCVYIYPDRTEEHDAHVSSWVRASRAELDIPLWRAVTDWLEDDWPFERVAYAARPASA